MASHSADNWKSYYLQHPDNEAINQQMEKVLTFCHYDLTTEACMKNLKDNPRLVGIWIELKMSSIRSVRCTAGHPFDTRYDPVK